MARLAAARPGLLPARVPGLRGLGAGHRSPACAAGMKVVAVTNTYPGGEARRPRTAWSDSLAGPRRRRPARALRGLSHALALPRRRAGRKRQAEHRFDFNRSRLAGRVVLVPGGAGGLGAAITALLLQEGALPVVGYRRNRGRALAFQQKLQDLYGGPVTLVEGDVDDAGRARSATWTPRST